MAACLETDTNYLDMAAAGPRDVVGTADVDEEIALDAEFKKKGLTALVFFGIDPGASDVFARALYDQFDTVERLTVFDGDNSSADGVDFAPSFSPTTMVEECLILPPHAFENGKMIRRTVAHHHARVRLSGAGRAASRSGTSTTKRPSSCPCSWATRACATPTSSSPSTTSGSTCCSPGASSASTTTRRSSSRAPGSGRSTCSSVACPSRST